MADLPITLAISDYDHVRDLTAGKVKPEGIQLRSLAFPVEEISFRFTLFREWDVSEMSLAKYSSLIASGDESLTAIPVFPSRVFRHSSIYVRADAGIREPADLRGKRVGVPEWAQTAGVYARGMLVDDYGLDLANVEWFQGGINQAGRKEKLPVHLPKGIRCTGVANVSLSEMLIAGDLEAVITAHPPEGYHGPGGTIVRLFEDYVPVEADYYARTGIFPIMHIIALRREIFDAHPWVAMNLLKAFEQAKQNSLARVREITASRIPIPWGYRRFEEAETMLGQEPWSYGIEPNRTTLEKFLCFCHEQGVCPRVLQPEELVPAQVQASFRI